MSKKSAAPPEKLELYEKLVATRPEAERKGAAMPYTSLNGHMFSFMTETGTLALRLPDGERETFLKTYRTKLCERHGTVMKEFVVVPHSLLKRTRELGKWFDRSIAYVASLKPKAKARKTGGKKKATPKKRASNKTGTRKAKAKR